MTELELDLVYACSREDRSKAKLLDLIKFSVARCARVSFLRHGLDHSDPSKDIESHDRFIQNGHWSSLEHQAQAPLNGEWVHPRFSGNLPGWIQYRQTIQPNVHVDFDWSILEQFPSDLESCAPE